MASKFILENDKYVIDKDPNAVLDYIWPYTAWLDAIPDTIASISTESTGVTVQSAGHTDKEVVVWVSGGTISKTQLASVTVRITTVGGRIDDRTAYFRIKAK